MLGSVELVRWNVRLEMGDPMVFEPRDKRGNPEKEIEIRANGGGVGVEV